MRFVQLLGLWTAISVPASMLVAVFLHAGQAGRPEPAPVVTDPTAR
jgi:hypothetical protein